MKILKGMKDITDDKANKYQKFIKIATNIVEKYNFKLIKTPILEETTLFKRSAGDSSDIVNKEMYSFLDKGNNEITMRPEGTAGVVRYFMENGLDKLNKKEKLFYYGSMFRYENPQKGRFREFNQFGCESFGENSIYEDVSILIMAKEILDNLNIKYKIKINYLGCKSCNPVYKNKLKEYFTNEKENICEDCLNRLEKNPLRILDCKIDSKKELFIKSPKLIESLCETCNSKLEELKKLLEINNIEYIIDTNLVRGLDYYNGLVFEITSDQIGSQDALCGGGRYDTLIKDSFNGKETSAIGFGMGIERIIDLMKIDNESEDIYYIGGLTKECLDLVFKIGIKLRKNYKTFIEYNPKSFPKQINQAEKFGCNKFILIGENELNSTKIRIKDLNTKIEEIKEIF